MSASHLADSAERNSAEQASTANAQVAVLATDAIAERERFSYWREAVCRSVFNMSIEALPDRFAARITSRGSGMLRFATSETSGYTIIRTRRDIDAAPADHYSVFAQVNGQSTITQCGDSLTYNADDICISDGRRPFQADLVGQGMRAFAVIPRAMIDRRAPWLRDVPLRKLGAGSPFVDLARRHIVELTTNNSMSESATNLLTENLCNLLALGSATDLVRHRMEPELQVEALLAFCRQNLHDSELTPQLAADYLGISVRTLHLRFKQIGQTFGRWVLEQRLEACHAALCDAGQSALNISEIAYRWGFNDLSYFNKAFRARFDRTPREWRNGEAHEVSPRLKPSSLA